MAANAPYTASGREIPPEIHEHESAKERIVSAATHLFAEKGYETASVRAIVEAAGVTKPVLYYYFKNKEDLFQRIVSDSMGAFIQTLEQVCASDFASLAEQLHAILSLYMRTAEQNPELVRFVHSLAYSGHYNDLYDFDALWEKMVALVADAMERAAAKGWVRHDVESPVLALHFVGICMNVMRQIVFCPEAHDAPLAFNPIQLVLEGMTPRHSNGRA